MKTLSEHIQDIIKNNDFLEDGLYNGYINITGLALHIITILKKKLGKDISLDSVKMALSRMSKKIKHPVKTPPFNSRNIFIRKGLNIIFFRYNKEVGEGLKKISKIESKYLTKINGNKETSIIFDDFYRDLINESLDTSTASLERSNLVLVGIDIKDSIIDQPGLLYKISKGLFFYGINIIEVIQTHNEASVIVRREDLRNTVDVICSI